MPGLSGDFLVAQRVKCLPTMWETQVRSLGWEDALEKAMATRSSTLAWENPMDEGVWQAIVHEESDTTERLDFFYVYCKTE